MKSDKKIIWLLISLLAIVVVIFFINQLQQSLKLSQNNQLKNFFTNLDKQTPALTNNSPDQGNPQAKLVIFEYGDFFCPPCQQAALVTEQVLKNYSDKVLFIWKDYPSPLHPQSPAAAKAARCAHEQEKFWPYHDLLLANQDKLDDKFYLQAATTLDLDLNKFQQCLANQEIDQLIDTDLNEGILLQVDATPYFFIGQTRVSGYIDYQQFVDLIEQELTKTN